MKKNDDNFLNETAKIKHRGPLLVGGGPQKGISSSLPPPLDLNVTNE